MVLFDAMDTSAVASEQIPPFTPEQIAEGLENLLICAPGSSAPELSLPVSSNLVTDVRAGSDLVLLMPSVMLWRRMDDPSEWQFEGRVWKREPHSSEQETADLLRRRCGSACKNVIVREADERSLHVAILGEVRVPSAPGARTFWMRDRSVFTIQPVRDERGELFQVFAGQSSEHQSRGTIRKIGARKFEIFVSDSTPSRYFEELTKHIEDEGL